MTTPKNCPRCSAPVVGGCTRCTWPNTSYMQMTATLAKRGVDRQGHDITDEGLEDFVSNLPDTTTLTDSKGRKVVAKVFAVAIHDGQVDVTFEFDPEGWEVSA